MELYKLAINPRRHVLTIVDQEMGVSIFADNVKLNGIYFIEYQRTASPDKHIGAVTTCVLTVDKEKFISNHKGLRLWYEDEQQSQPG